MERSKLDAEYVDLPNDVSCDSNLSDFVALSMDDVRMMSYLIVKGMSGFTVTCYHRNFEHFAHVRSFPGCLQTGTCHSIAKEAWYAPCFQFI